MGGTCSVSLLVRWLKRALNHMHAVHPPASFPQPPEGLSIRKPRPPC